MVLELRSVFYCYLQWVVCLLTKCVLFGKKVNADLWQTMPLELAIRKEQKKVTEIPVSNGARPNQSSSQS